MKHLAIFLVTLFGSSLGAEYDDSKPDGPKNWGGMCKLGRSQSPIDVPSDDAIYDEDLELSTLTLSDYDMNWDLLCLNKGYTVECDIIDQDGKHPQVTKAGLKGTYGFAQFHFHWGADESEGSEHYLNGEKFPLEVHWVHMNENYYGMPSEILGNKDGATVLGFFFKIVDKENEAWKPIFDAFKGLTYKGQTQNVAGIKLQDLLGDMSAFYRYMGGLTTPGCQEVVTWNVFEKPIEVSRAQLESFRGHYQSKESDAVSRPLPSNFRPVQPLNKRKVYYSLDNGNYPGNGNGGNGDPVGAATSNFISKVLMFISLFLAKIAFL